MGLGLGAGEGLGLGLGLGSGSGLGLGLGLGLGFPNPNPNLLPRPVGLVADEPRGDGGVRLGEADLRAELGLGRRTLREGAQRPARCACAVCVRRMRGVCMHGVCTVYARWCMRGVCMRGGGGTRLIEREPRYRGDIGEI